MKALKNLNWIGFNIFSFLPKSNFDFHQSYSTLFIIQDVKVADAPDTQLATHNTHQADMAPQEISQLVERCFPDLVVNEIKCLNPISVVDFFDNPQPQSSNEVLVPRFSGDLKKIQNANAYGTGDFNLVVSEQWNFEAVRKLPWKFHTQGVRPYFFDVNRNLHWQKEKKVFKRLYEKGVILPVDLISIVHWQIKSSIWWKAWFYRGSRDAKQAKVALYLSEMEIDAPLYMYLSELNKLSQTHTTTQLN